MTTTRLLPTLLMASLLPFGALAHADATDDAATASFCRPTQPCWPSAPQWQGLAASVGGRLERPQLPFAACVADSKSAACAAAIEALRDPYWIQEQSGGSESLGWLGAWTSTPSAYAVVAESAADIAAAVRFAGEHRLRVVIKGTGHDYLGRSNAPDSLLIWTHRMRHIESHQRFTPAGCAAAGGVPAISVGAGTRWLEAYREATGKQGRYVQGGGCTSVGAAGGFLQGGGFGTFSKRYGIAAGSLLEAEVVTADGRVRVANRCQNADLFWALRGGGGGTFGVVTRVTLMTHELPRNFGFVFGSLSARDEAAYTELVERFLDLQRRSLSDEHWGGEVRVTGDNALELSLGFQGMSAAEAELRWKPLRAWIEQHPERFTMKARFVEMPASKMWDDAFLTKNAPDAIHSDARRSGDFFWWATNQGEVATYWWAYQSRWIPAALFAESQVAGLARTLVAASRHWPIELHFNKGQAGAAADALARDRQTSMNPAVLQAATLAIVAATGGGHPSVRGREPDVADGARQRAGVTAAMKILRAATPGAGSYVNETDYFEPDWKRAFWGENYERLLAIKHKYDPSGLFFCHHCVGSDEARPPQR